MPTLTQLVDMALMVVEGVTIIALLGLIACVVITLGVMASARSASRKHGFAPAAQEGAKA